MKLEHFNGAAPLWDDCLQDHLQFAFSTKHAGKDTTAAQGRHIGLHSRPGWAACAQRARLARNAWEQELHGKDRVQLGREKGIGGYYQCGREFSVRNNNVRSGKLQHLVILSGGSPKLAVRRLWTFAAPAVSLPEVLPPLLRFATETAAPPHAHPTRSARGCSSAACSLAEKQRAATTTGPTGQHKWGWVSGLVG